MLQLLMIPFMAETMEEFEKRGIESISSDKAMSLSLSIIQRVAKEVKLPGGMALGFSMSLMPIIKLHSKTKDEFGADEIIEMFSELLDDITAIQELSDKVKDGEITKEEAIESMPTKQKFEKSRDIEAMKENDTGLTGLQKEK